MANGNEFASELDFEQSMGKMTDRKLIEFVARQTLEITDRCRVHDQEIASLKSGDRKMSGVVGGISGTISSMVIGIISYFTNQK